MTTLYRLKLSLLEPNIAINQCHRVLEIADNASFEELGEHICQAFEHSPSQGVFLLSYAKTDKLDELVLCQTRVGTKLLSKKAYPPSTSLAMVSLGQGDYFYWQTHDCTVRLRLEKILQKGDELPKITKIVGNIADFHLWQSPDTTQFNQTQADSQSIQPNDIQVNQPQASQPQANQTKTDQSQDSPPPQKQKPTISADMERELELVSALMLVVADTVRWQELVDNGVADELVKRNLIKPCVSPTHKVRPTPFGESQLAQFLQVSGLMDKLDKKLH